jgi:hypothetical protein
VDRRARRKGARSQAGAEGEGTRRAGARTQEAFLAALSNNGYASAKEVMMLGNYLSCRSTAQVEQVCPNATEEKSPRQYLPIQIPARHGLMKSSTGGGFEPTAYLQLARKDFDLKLTYIGSEKID